MQTYMKQACNRLPLAQRAPDKTILGLGWRQRAGDMIKPAGSIQANETSACAMPPKQQRTSG
ncbi:hypothetical protein C4K02_1835 [Pseudomonas synxantha]|nr:hypothetical protein C4K02_1835 [Pseudomonas synxantha]